MEVVRRVYDAWNAGDMTALRDLGDPDVGDTLEPVTDFIDTADRVVVRDGWRGTGQGPDADMEFSRVFPLRERDSTPLSGLPQTGRKRA